MPFQKGREKTGGRTRGVPNKLSATIRERLGQQGVDPVSGLLSIAEHRECSLELKAKALSDLISYCYPKLKNVELSTPALSDFSLDELRAMLTKIAAARDPNTRQTIQ
jgi:hypothetical protein